MLPSSPTKLRREVLLVLSDIGSRHHAILYVKSIENVVIFSVTSNLVLPPLSLDFFLRKQWLDAHPVYSRMQRDLAIEVGDEILVVADKHLLGAFPVFFPEQRVCVRC